MFLFDRFCRVFFLIKYLKHNSAAKAAVQEARKKERMDDETPRYVLWYGEDRHFECDGMDHWGPAMDARFWMQVPSDCPLILFAVPRKAKESIDVLDWFKKSDFH